MSFWSGEKLLAQLPKLIDKFDPKRIDCAAYTLTVGRDLYVTPSSDAQPEFRTRRTLEEGAAFEIPAGQFAFLMSEEVVRVPSAALAFISMKARTKYKGLVNVSGFHVDPGFDGRLVFSVFNAGPRPIHLSQGQLLFLIWYADLDDDSKYVRNGPQQLRLDPDLITGLSGELHSLAAFNARIEVLDATMRAAEKEREHLKSDLEKERAKLDSETERRRTAFRWGIGLAATVLGILVAIGLYELRKNLDDAKANTGNIEQLTKRIYALEAQGAVLMRVLPGAIAGAAPPEPVTPGDGGTSR